MRTRHWTLIPAALCGAAIAWVVLHAGQRTASAAPALTAQDYFEIQQLANLYPYLIPTCDGEAYADMYAADGVFIDRWSNNGVKEGGIRWQGREKLAEAAGSGPLECNKSGLVS